MRQWGVNNLPKVVAQQRYGRGSNPRPLDRKSDALPHSHRGLGRVGLDRVGSQNSRSWMGGIGSGLLSKISNKYTIYTQETYYSMTIIHNDTKL